MGKAKRQSAAKAAAANNKSATRPSGPSRKLKSSMLSEKRKTIAIQGSVAALVIAVFAAVVVFITQSNEITSLDDLSAEQIPAASTANGFLMYGDAGAPARVDLYKDFGCPYCSDFSQGVEPDLIELAEQGEVAVYFFPVAYLDYAFPGGKYSSRAANAFATVADREPEYMVAFKEVLFNNQPEEGTSGLSDDELRDLAISVGVSEETADMFTDNLFSDWVYGVSDKASQDGISVIPTILVNGDYFTGNWYDVMKEDGTVGLSAGELIADIRGEELS